jgi:2-C-methyl-D-erythritol 4-phosphate cytidylyltransferase
MFRVALLHKALAVAAAQGLSVTDEASALELAGWQPMMVEGHSDNIKITLPQDLALAALYLQQQAGESTCV